MPFIGIRDGREGRQILPWRIFNKRLPMQLGWESRRSYSIEHISYPMGGCRKGLQKRHLGEGRGPEELINTGFWPQFIPHLTWDQNEETGCSEHLSTPSLAEEAGFEPALAMPFTDMVLIIIYVSIIKPGAWTGFFFLQMSSRSEPFF